MKDEPITIEDLINKIKDKNSKEISKIKEAYEFALKEHLGLKRLSGDDYITHPLHVAKILAELNVDNTTIIAALLHEVLNNGQNATEEDIAKKFGVEVVNIIVSISKINKLELLDDKESSAIYLRKVLVGLAEDPRVLYIKLADRLHNMRTSWAIEIDKQKAKAKETMAVLVPIAHRLGINSIKSELEDRCLRVLKPNVYNDILEKLNKTKAELNDKLIEMKDNITKLLNENGIQHEIKGRVKSVYSIYNKLSKGRSYNDIYDILALRVFVKKESECYTTIGLIHSKYKPVPKRFKDYIANPKENRYQSLHTTVYGSDGDVYEVQVRTYEMDEIAEKGLASHWSYKEVGTKKIQEFMEQKLKIFRDAIESNSDKTDISFQKVINSDLLKELIYVFTPKGDVVELPKGSTPIDFAYHIHSRIGNTAVGAIVNDNIVSLSSILQNDDIIKIITNNNAKPNKDWLKFVKTPQAKAKIKSFFSKKDHDEIINKGKSLLEKELKKRKLTLKNIFNDDNLSKIDKDLSINSLDDFYLAIGSGKITPTNIINQILDDEKKEEDLKEKLNLTKKFQNNKNDIIVDGNTNILYSLAKCCKPVKGDEIMGFITKSSGVSVHKKDCINLNRHQDKLINVKWNENSDNSYLTDIKLYIQNNKVFTELIKEITKLNINIYEIHNSDSVEGILSKLTIKVKNKDELEYVKNKIRNFKNMKVIN